MQADTSEETGVLGGVEPCVVVVGVGLIGGSIAAAVRAADPGGTVIGIGRNVARMQVALDRGLITRWANSVSEAAIPPGSLGVVCLPVDRIVEAVRELLAAGCGAVTDAGSAKGEICRELAAERLFVGAHPIAGSEQAGFEHADANLFGGRVCVLCEGDAEPAVVARVERFWRSLGLSLQFLSATEHDRILALTSHLPHVLASVAAGVVTDEQLVFAGSGFRDTTRIAAGSADLWTSILLGNADACVESIRRAETLLGEFRGALERRDAVLLRALWAASAERRRKL
ncbi:MAG: prephenate dehydrogenase [Planctomycetaceae bacterium]